MGFSCERKNIESDLCSVRIMCVFAISVLSLDMLFLLTPQAPLTWCADGTTAQVWRQRRVRKLFCVHDILCSRLYFLHFYTTIHTKIKKQLSTLYRKVGFGQPARQESVNLIVTRHWKTITCQKTCFQDLLFQQHNGIAKVQSCMSIKRGVGEKPSDW